MVHAGVRLLLVSSCLALAGAGAALSAEAARQNVSDEVRAAAEAARGEESQTDAIGEGHPGEAAHPAAGHEENAGDESDHAGDPPEEEHAGAIWQTEREPMPFEVIRSLQYLQDQAARGNKAALQVQRRLLRRFGPSLSARSSDVWTDKRNVRAVVLFVLSGGPSAPLSELYRAGVFEEKHRPLIEGVLAYADNRMDEAEAKLSTIDLSREETIFAAQVRLALAQLREAEDPAGSLMLLEQVMLAAPGTLLDEAALRLGVLLAENAGETEKADRYARQYFDRYAASVYAGNFRTRFSAVYSDRPKGSEEATLDTLAGTLRLLPDDQKLAMYLSVARRALVGGNLELAAEASREALTIEAADPADRQRALLYEVASTLSALDEGEILATLGAIEDEQLHPSDLALKEAALDVVDAIREPAEISASAGNTDPALDNQTLKRAASLIDAVERDLENFAP
ncbi:hypothetical protein [Fulvimarina pelagi]|uniref:hypothetical protein n=1 Tax=Fulvimarina pelagi TaxID=217511 RepID=UPI0002D9195E|nr:hypothetical protein [Fulvimarina pelagi]